MKQLFAPIWGLAVCLAAPSPARADASPPAAPPAGDKERGERVTSDKIDTQLELQLEQVVPLARFRGKATVAAADPRFVVAGKVSWVQRAEVIALHSQQAFAVHSPTLLGLNGWQPGDTICLLLTRTRSNGETRWRLQATVPDAGCH
jgi:hypothetical protein